MHDGVSGTTCATMHSDQNALEILVKCSLFTPSQQETEECLEDKDCAALQLGFGMLVLHLILQGMTSTATKAGCMSNKLQALVTVS